MSTPAATVIDLLGSGADGATALSAPGGIPLTYQQLRHLVTATASALQNSGIGRNDRVALVLENGPHAATAFFSVAAVATAAPLNPGYRAEEFEFYLLDLKARLLIVEAWEGDKASPAVAVARKLGIAVAHLTVEPERGAGAFSLTFPEAPPTKTGEPQLSFASADDIALVLHTSGTTSRPKICPLEPA